MGFFKGIWNTLKMKGAQNRQSMSPTLFPLNHHLTFIKTEPSGADKQNSGPDVNQSSSQTSTPTLGLQLRLTRSNSTLEALRDSKTKEQDKRSITSGEGSSSRAAGQNNVHQVEGNTGERQGLYTWFEFDDSWDPIPDEYHPNKRTRYYHPQEEERAASSDGINNLMELTQRFGRLNIQSSVHQDTSEHTDDSGDISERTADCEDTIITYTPGSSSGTSGYSADDSYTPPLPDEYNPENTPSGYYLAGCVSLAAIEARSARQNNTTAAAASGQNNTPGIPSGPYPFYRNPLHPTPENNPNTDSWGLNNGCPDACPDCEIWAGEVFRGRDRVNAWFDEHFTFEDSLEAQIDDYPETGPIDTIDDPPLDYYFDRLHGATDHNELPHYDRVFLEAERDGYTTGAAVIRNMQNGEREHWERLPYHHGTRYDAILAEYEPRYIPHDGYWPYNADRPIWEARGWAGPGQEEDTREQCMILEYERQWEMYHLQDDARRQYIADVTANARRQYEEYFSELQQQ